MKEIFFSLQFPFLLFGWIGGTLFYIWAIYVIVGMWFTNKSLIELVTFGLIKKDKNNAR